MTYSRGCRHGVEQGRAEDGGFELRGLAGSCEQIHRKCEEVASQNLPCGRCQAAWSRSGRFFSSAFVGRLMPTLSAGAGVLGRLRKRSGCAVPAGSCRGAARGCASFRCGSLVVRTARSRSLCGAGCTRARRMPRRRGPGVSVHELWHAVLGDCGLKHLDREHVNFAVLDSASDELAGVDIGASRDVLLPRRVGTIGRTGR